MTEENQEEKIDQAVWKRAEIAIEAAKNSAKGWRGESRVEDVRLFGGYAEPGYHCESNVVAVGDWNSINRYDRESNKFILIDDVAERLGKVLENIGVDLQWEDEWKDCSCCNKIFRTHADSYGWQPSYVTMEDECICVDCLEEEAEEYLEGLEGDAGKINSVRAIDPEDHGYTQVEEFEAGWHRGQDASPEKIAAILEKSEFERWLFHQEYQGQFDMRFSVYLHEEEAKDGGLEKLQELLRNGETDGPSRSEALKRQLQEASVKEAELRKSSPNAIVYATVGDDGVKVREVSPEEFVKGIKR